MKELTRTQFGNPILRQVARELSIEEIVSPKAGYLIKNMRHTLLFKKLGVGLAAPQIGQGIALSVIAIRPTKHRPKTKNFDLVIINPKITKCFGYRTQIWEGCLSAGPSGLFAKVPRYKKVELEYIDENGNKHKKVFTGLQAQVIQHEVDHLKGRLFMDLVKDPKTYATLKEYKRRVVSKLHK